MIKDYNQEFGPEGIFAWPACPEVAERFIEAAPYAKSGPDCLNNDFFYGGYLDCLDAHLFRNYPHEEALELAEAAAKARQELLKDARNWPLPYLVASATYKILSTKPEGVHMITNLWYCFLWPFLCFDEPLFGMLRSKGWGKIYKNEMREGFKSRLRADIDGLTGCRVMWGGDKEKPWFTCKFFTSYIYPEDVLRCLELVGIDPGLAHSAVDQVFKLQSLIPLYDVLSDEPFSMPATIVKGRHRSEEGETGSPKKPSPDLRIHVLNSIYGALLLAGVAIASTRLRSSRSKWTSTPSDACFATASRIGNVRLNERPDHNNAPAEGLNQHPPLATGITAQRPRSRPMLTALKKMTANLPTLKLSRTKPPSRPGVRWPPLANEGVSNETPFPFFIKTDERIRRQTTKKKWRICNALQSESLQSHRLENQSSGESSGEPAEQAQPLRKEKSAAHLFRQALSDGKTEAQKLTHKLYNRIIDRIDRKDTWVEDGRIFTEGSPEVKAFRIELKAQGKHLPAGTSLCIHAQRTGAVIKTTTQGTVTDRNRQERVMAYIVKYFRIDGQQVVKGDVHENDHVFSNKIADIAGLREADPTYDCARTVKMTHKLHALRTAHYAKVKPRYSLKDLTKPLSGVLKPMEKANRDVWSDKKHRDAIFQDGVTPNFLLKQYAEAHRHEVSRMTEDLIQKGFDTRQATAYVTDGMLREAIESSAREFISCLVSCPKLKDESVLEKITPFARHAAKQCYLEKVREFNLIRLRKYYSDCTALAGDLELYSDSPEGARDSCTASQTARHRETKIEAINSFKKALQKGFTRGLEKGHISQIYLNTRVDEMLAVANVDKDRTSRAGQLTTKELKDRIRTRGKKLRINSLHYRDSVFTIQKPSLENDTRFYEECVQSAATKGREEPLDQDDIFL